MPIHDFRPSAAATTLAGVDTDGLPDGTVELTLSHQGILDKPPRLFSGSTSGDDPVVTPYAVQQ